VVKILLIKRAFCGELTFFRTTGRGCKAACNLGARGGGSLTVGTMGLTGAGLDFFIPQKL